MRLPLTPALHHPPLCLSGVLRMLLRLKVLVNRDIGEHINKRLLVPLSFNLLSLKLLDDPSIYSVQNHFLVFPFPYGLVNFP